MKPRNRAYAFARQMVRDARLWKQAGDLHQYVWCMNEAVEWRNLGRRYA